MSQQELAPTEFEERTVTMEELHALVQSGEYDIEVDSLDGFVEVTQSMFSGKKPVYEVQTTEGLAVRASETHPIETIQGWKQVSELEEGFIVKTNQGLQKINAILNIAESETYDIDVNHPNHRFLANGISVHNCYGGSAWTVSRNMNESPEEAQVKIDNFFRALTVLNQFMIEKKRAVLETGRVANLFNRIRNMTQWAFSRDRKDKGYAERTALNHPIQSTAAELLKISSLRVDEYIMKNGLNPLSGLSMPQEIDFKEVTYLDIVLALLSSVHDELVFHLRGDQFDEQLPRMYKEMQINDVMEAFNAGYCLELDVEYDSARAWTADSAYPTAKTYLLNRLSSSNPTAMLNEAPNLCIIEFENFGQQQLTAVNSFRAGDDTEEDLFTLGVRVKEHIYLHECKFPLSFLEQLETPFTVAHLE